MRLLCLEASAGRVVGGSLTGLVHLLGGIDRDRYEPVVALYEEKSVADAWRASGIPVHVLARRRLPKEHALQGTGGYERIRAKPAAAGLLQRVRRSATFVLETLPAALPLASLIRRERIDVVYACNGIRGNAEAIVAAALTGVPCVVHAKGFDKFSFVERLLAPRVACCVSMTQAIEDHCRQAGLRPTRYRVVFDGLDFDAFRPQRDAASVRREFEVPDGAPLLGVVGNVQPWKGQHVLLESVLALRGRWPDTVALIVGGVHRAGEDYAAELHAFVERHGLERNVRFTGPRDDVPDLMNAMDVVVHSSVRAEPFGRVILEAMALGRAVIATRAGGVPEFVRDGRDGRLVEPGDVGDMAGALSDLLADDERRAVYGTTAKAAAERFRIERHVEAMQAVFDDVAERSGIALAARSAAGTGPS